GEEGEEGEEETVERLRNEQFNACLIEVVSDLVKSVWEGRRRCFVDTFREEEEEEDQESQDIMLDQLPHPLDEHFSGNHEEVERKMGAKDDGLESKRPAEEQATVLQASCKSPESKNSCSIEKQPTDDISSPRTPKKKVLEGKKDQDTPKKEGPH
ncbi:hypothetical protein ADUPG1_000263, partial [Aduncisulcus paluster]